MRREGSDSLLWRTFGRLQTNRTTISRAFASLVGASSRASDKDSGGRSVKDCVRTTTEIHHLPRVVRLLPRVIHSVAPSMAMPMTIHAVAHTHGGARKSRAIVTASD
jgi:hypothetical protein